MHIEGMEDVEPVQNPLAPEAAGRPWSQRVQQFKFRKANLISKVFKEM